MVRTYQQQVSQQRRQGGGAELCVRMTA